MLLEQVGKVSAGELAALIGVEDLRHAIFRDDLPHRVQTEKSVVSVFDRRQESTRRECQSITATR